MNTTSSAGGRKAPRINIRPGRAYVEGLRGRLADAVVLCMELGLAVGARRQSHGLLVRCPWHDDSTPSCSVRRADTGAVHAKCFACGARGDVFALIAQVRRLGIITQFAAVLAEAERIADAMLVVAPAPDAAVLAPDEPRLPDSDFDRVAVAVLGVCSIDAAPDVCEYLAHRGLLDEARQDGWGALPASARAQSEIAAHVCAVMSDETWARSGLSGDSAAFTFKRHRLLIPWRDATGTIGALQRRVLPPDGDDGRKYVFSRGRSPRMPYGIERVSATGAAIEIAFVEGATDALAMRALCERRCAKRVVLGVPGVSNWQSEWSGLAAGRVAHVAFDADAAGDKVAALVAADLYQAGASRVFRTRPAEAKDWAQLLERDVP